MEISEEVREAWTCVKQLNRLYPKYHPAIILADFARDTLAELLEADHERRKWQAHHSQHCKLCELCTFADWQDEAERRLKGR